MGKIKLPTSDLVYIDANIAIYAVEKHPLYSPILRPLWVSADAGKATIVSSELLILETLTGAHKKADRQLADDYEQFFAHPSVKLIPITQSVLADAAQLRAKTAGLRVPDALHAATFRIHACSVLLTNDRSFSQIHGVNVMLLDTFL